MNNYCVYMHKNKINGKVYIGQTCQDPERRWREGNGYKDSPRFYNAICKYGWENFEHIILKDGLTSEEADQSECELISAYQSNKENFGYNMTPGGNNYMSELWKDEDFKKRMSLSFSKARKALPDEEKQKIINKMVIATKQAWQNEAWRENRIKNLMGSKNTNSKRVKNLETDIIFDTIKEASEWCGLKSVSGIGQCCRGKRNISGRHPITNQPLHWEYYKGGE